MKFKLNIYFSPGNDYFGQAQWSYLPSSLSQDVHVELGYERNTQQELHMEQAMRRLRDQVLWAALQHREALALCQRDSNKGSQKDAQVRHQECSDYSLHDMSWLMVWAH